MIVLFEQEEAVKRYGNRMRSEGHTEGRSEGRVAAYAEMVADGTLTVDRAAQKLGMTVEGFKEAVDALSVTA